MSNILNNTTNLQAILDTINALPDSGSSGGSSNPVLYGTYMLTKNPAPLASSTAEYSLEGRGVKAYFYDGESYQYLSLTHVRMTESSIGFEVLQGTEWARTLHTTDNNEWNYGFVNFTDPSDVSSGSLPDSKGLFITFTTPVSLDQNFYDAFIAVVDTDTVVYDEGYDHGYGVGYSDGHDVGYNEGVVAGALEKNCTAEITNDILYIRVGE
jgi:hypothetical protein